MATSKPELIDEGDNKPFSFRCPEKLIERVEAISKQTNVGRSEVMVAFIRWAATEWEREDEATEAAEKNNLAGYCESCGWKVERRPGFESSESSSDAPLRRQMSDNSAETARGRDGDSQRRTRGRRDDGVK